MVAAPEAGQQRCMMPREFLDNALWVKGGIRIEGRQAVFMSQEPHPGES